MPQSLIIGSLEIQLYFLFDFLAYFAVLLINWWYAIKYKIPVWKALIITVIMFLATFGWIYVMAWIESGFTVWGNNNSIRAWVYTPIFLVICAKLFKVEKNRLLDFSAPCFMVAHTVSHIGCIFAGCCYGFPYNGAIKIWNNPLKAYLFPIQLFESFGALLIVIFIIVVAYKKKFSVSGRMYPTMLFTYGLQRFVFEFFRDNEKIWIGCSSLSFHALFAVLVCGLWLFFTTPTGAIIWLKITNVFRKLFKKPLVEIPTKEEMKAQIKAKQDASLNVEGAK